MLRAPPADINEAANNTDTMRLLVKNTAKIFYLKH